MWVSDYGYNPPHRYYVSYTMKRRGDEIETIQWCSNIYSLKAYIEYVLEESNYLSLKSIRDESDLPIYYQNGELSREWRTNNGATTNDTASDLETD